MFPASLERFDAECSLSVHQREPTDVSAQTFTHFFQRGVQTSAKEVANTTQGEDRRKEKQRARKCKQMRTSGETSVQTSVCVGGGKQANKQSKRAKANINTNNNTYTTKQANTRKQQQTHKTKPNKKNNNIHTQLQTTTKK